MAGHDGQRTVLLAVDPSKQALEAVDYYIKHLHKADNLVVLIHVVDLPDLAHARQVYLSPHALAEMWKEEGDKAKSLETKLKNYLNEKGVEHVKCRTEGGLKPGQVICQIANDEKATMVVMGTRGMGKIRRTLLGSVSDFVVHHAHCPVVVCRQKCPQTEPEDSSDSSEAVTEQTSS